MLHLGQGCLDGLHAIHRARGNARINDGVVVVRVVDARGDGGPPSRPRLAGRRHRVLVHEADHPADIPGRRALGPGGAQGAGIVARFDPHGDAIPDAAGHVEREPFVLLAYPVAVFLAIFRYQLFDLALVVRRSLVYATLTGLMVLIFYAGVGAGGALVARFVEDEASVWVIAGATLLLGLLFAPLHRGVQSFIERQFFPERHVLRQRLTALTAELASIGNLPLMGQYLVERLRDIFAVRGVTVLLADPASRLLLTLAKLEILHVDFPGFGQEHTMGIDAFRSRVVGLHQCAALSERKAGLLGRCA